MISIKTILCPVDFFPASDRAVNYAAGLAANYGAKIHLLHVVAPVVPTAYEYLLNTAEIVKSMEEAAAREMNKLVAKLKARGVEVEGELRVGEVYGAIERRISQLKPDIVAMGTHGRHGVDRWFLGSVTEWLMRHSPVPVLTISESERLTTPAFKQILLTTDFSDGTTDALEYAFSIAQENASSISLLHAISNLTVEVPAPYRDSLVKGVEKQLEDLIPSGAEDWCTITTRVEQGLPYRVILQILDKEKPDLLVMNIHGKGMLERALVGSTAERVVRAARCPVMLIPPMKKVKAAKKARLNRRVA